MTLKFNRVLKVVEVSVAVHEIVYTNFLPYLAMAKNPKIRSCNLDI